LQKSTSIGFQENIYSAPGIIVTLVVPILFSFAKSDWKISSLMVPSISERKLPLVIHSFFDYHSRSSLPLERYSELHFMLCFDEHLIALILLFF
jgi:hypothetical protein